MWQREKSDDWRIIFDKRSLLQWFAGHRDSWDTIFEQRLTSFWARYCSISWKLVCHLDKNFRQSTKFLVKNSTYLTCICSDMTQFSYSYTMLLLIVCIRDIKNEGLFTRLTRRWTRTFTYKARDKSAYFSVFRFYPLKSLLVNSPLMAIFEDRWNNFCRKQNQS